jgi:ankyrin repeat protein
MLIFTTQEIEYSYLERVLQSSPEGLPSILFKNLIEKKDNFNDTINNIKNLCVASSSIKQSFSRAIKDISTLDYIIAALYSKQHKRNLNDVFFALDDVLDVSGDKVVEIWLERLKELKSYLQVNFRQESEESWKALVKTFPAFMTYYEMKFSLKNDYVQKLVDLKRKFYVDMVDKYGRTPLMYAAFVGVSDTIHRLIKRGAVKDRLDN